MALHEGLKAHLAGGLTTLCRAWAITRADGTEMGFTDHDRDLSFEGLAFCADTGLSAMALQQGTGLAVDNTEAVGALSDAAITEADILAGRFDGAGVRAWLVNWADVAQRQLLFRGTIGEMRRVDGAFQAELRGLSEALNRPFGRVYQAPCTAVLGDASCKFDLDQPGYHWEGPVLAVEETSTVTLDGDGAFEPGWFQRGRLEVLSGAAHGRYGAIKRDVPVAEGREIELWEPLRAQVAVGDVVRITAGCDKRMETCRLKFNNLLNFRGFPDLPEDDWLIVNPSKSGQGTGGSRR
ncbi:DUF2163 domain-containing protein [Primorskyibacter aestuariivivens]|uniref:DUF2163 domain-containing protein n=1 Tax=Primorskyibacter aestuariivivens TaxID=1888912 RepID=UPI0023001341|nr:DUF2163 domain-containing protein [Primorskyibacter aestuariivivens]MDA7429835.1 DUF2163 domain-containing protein [Primorskyibacter aestuariivivens]